MRNAKRCLRAATFACASALGVALTTPAATAYGSVSGTIHVSATVVSNCRLVTAPLVFATYDPLVLNRTTPANAHSVQRAYCTQGVTPLVAARGGGTLQSASSSLAGGLVYRYALVPSSRGAGTAVPSTWTLSGTIPPAQDAPPGDYAGIIEVEIDF